jgi:Lar family restriction alleviation protein
MTELLGCPFCGGDDVADFHSITGDLHIACVDCDGRGPDRKSEAEAIAAWNTRAPIAGQAELVEALKPFAAFDDERAPEHLPITSGSGMARRQLTIGDCRKAKAALSTAAHSSQGRGK